MKVSTSVTDESTIVTIELEVGSTLLHRLAKAGFRRSMPLSELILDLIETGVSADELVARSTTPKPEPKPDQPGLFSSE